MPNYKYQAVFADGRKASGTIEAAADKQALEQLAGQGMIPTSLREARPSRIKALSQKELYAFTSQLANLLSAGLSLSAALEAVGQYGSKALSAVVEQVLAAVRSGSSLAGSLAAQSFPSFYLAMVRAGEAGGSLETNLTQLAEDLENQEEIRRQLKLTMLYPMVMLGATLAALALILVFILPRFGQLFSQLGGQLPLATRIVLGVGDFVNKRRWALLLLLALLAAWTAYVAFSPQGKKLWERTSLALPLLGPLFGKLHYVRFARTVGRLLAGGVSLPESLEIAQGSLDNYLLRDATRRVRAGIRKGGSFTVLLKEEGLFPPLAIQMLATGERAGNLEEMLLRSSELFRKECANQTKTLLALLEPAVIVFLGLVVFAVVAAIIVPLLSINVL